MFKYIRLDKYIHFDFFGAKTGILQENYDNTMAADANATSDARKSAFIVPPNP